MVAHLTVSAFSIRQVLIALEMFPKERQGTVGTVCLLQACILLHFIFCGYIAALGPSEQHQYSFYVCRAPWHA